MRTLFVIKYSQFSDVRVSMTTLLMDQVENVPLWFDIKTTVHHIKKKQEKTQINILPRVSTA